jgi:hypothetical protein
MNGQVSLLADWQLNHLHGLSSNMFYGRDVTIDDKKNKILQDISRPLSIVVMCRCLAQRA